jgi:hypothetical protein
MRSEHEDHGQQEEKFRRQMACKDVNEEIQQARGKAKETLGEEGEEPCVRLETPDLCACPDFRNLREILEAPWCKYTECVPRR